MPDTTKPDTPLEDKGPRLVPILTADGPSEIWVCRESDCAEGCNSDNPKWGIALVLEESRKLQAEQQK